MKFVNSKINISLPFCSRLLDLVSHIDNPKLKFDVSQQLIKLVGTIYLFSINMLNHLHMLIYRKSFTTKKKIKKST